MRNSDKSCTSHTFRCFPNELKCLWNFYEVSKKIYDFKDIQAIRSFGGGILENGIDELDKYNEKQADLLQYILESNSKTKPRSKVDIDKNWIL